MKSKRSADNIYEQLKTALKQQTVIIICIKNKDGETVNIISGIKSIARWGLGLFYGYRPNQKSFTKSVFLPYVELISH